MKINISYIILGVNFNNNLHTSNNIINIFNYLFFLEIVKKKFVINILKKAKKK